MSDNLLRHLFDPSLDDALDAARDLERDSWDDYAEEWGEPCRQCKGRGRIATCTHIECLSQEACRHDGAQNDLCPTCDGSGSEW